ncbi:MAG: YqeG family HAD IIIA-type phosphatase [Firmicutes bacterium HGW-Firmicutes-13]|nr:MAG: YqeG family HAD IIIA-type phosphatase [Firmicutes bacterium HGW-Firmicutes-13]
MLNLLCPNVYLKSIYDLDLDKLKKNGIKGIITDLDNTLIAWNQNQMIPKLDQWFNELKKENFKICIVSNNSQERVNLFADSLNIPAIPKAEKPRRKAFRLALQELKIMPHEGAVIGDQVFTDVLGGNRMGLFTVLVLPVSEHEFIGTKFVRKVERHVLQALKKKGMLPQ